MKLNPYHLTDTQTVEKIVIKDFQAVNLRLTLEIITESSPKRIPKRCIRDANTTYERCKKAYDNREPIFSEFQLDCEYFPIVIIRSLLPQLGHYLGRGDYNTAYMISKWVEDNVAIWTYMIHEFAESVGRSDRSFAISE